MKGEVCEICGALHEEDNPVVLDDGILLCLDCVGYMDMEEKDGQG